MARGMAVRRSGSVLVVFAVAMLAAAQPGEYNRRIPVREMTLGFDTSQCLSFESGVTYTVGKEFTGLQNLYRVCLPRDSIEGDMKPVRVMLVIDKSVSMCGERAYPAADPRNLRVAAALMFVDSLTARSPESEVGVITFWNGTALRQPPLPLSAAANITTLRAAIRDASCNGDAVGGKKASGYAGCPSGTCPGQSLEQALEDLDAGYARADTVFDRHIIFLTDGEWSGTPEAHDLYQNYVLANPNGAFPTFHGVFIFALEGDHFPLDPIRYLADTATDGEFTRLTDPSQLPGTFMQLLQTISRVVPRVLRSVTVTNLADQSTRTSSFVELADATNNVYRTSLPAMDLEVGQNAFVITRFVSRGTGQQDTLRDTLRIERLATSSTSTTAGKFVPVYERDTLLLAMAGAPRKTYPDQWTATSAVLDPSARQDLFRPTTITARAFVRFPADAQGTLALYRMDSSTADVTGANPGTGSPQFTSWEEGLFDAALAPGQSFTTSLPTLDGDFTIEAWVKPGAQGTSATVVSSQSTRLWITPSGLLEFTSTAGILNAPLPVDRGVWQHVAVSRRGGGLFLYVNGLPVAGPVVSQGTLSGQVTVGPVAGGMLDELRVSSTSQTSAEKGMVMLAIPTAPGLSWRITGTGSQGASAEAASAAWNTTPSMRLSVEMSDPRIEDVIVNLLHLDTGDSLYWSKNATPIRFANPDTAGPHITSVKYYLGNPPGQATAQDDTLIVTFSDSVVWQNFGTTLPEAVFNYFRTSGIDATVLAGAHFADTIGRTGVVLLLDRGRVTPLRDSLQLAPGPWVTDAAGNHAPTNGPRRVVEWGRDYEMTAVFGPAPFNPGVDLLPQGLTGRISPTRTNVAPPASAFAVQVLSVKPVDGQRSSMRIYDVVGNVVRSDLEYYRHEDGVKGYFLWDGLNEAGRKVGTGTYLGVISIYREGADPEYLRERIGIQR